MDGFSNTELYNSAGFLKTDLRSNLNRNDIHSSEGKNEDTD